MKQLLLIAFLAVSSFSAAHAGNRLSQTANDSAMAAGRIALKAKINQFSASTSTSASSAATQQAAKEVLDMMREGMSQTMRVMELSSSATAARAVNTHYLKMESASSTYARLLPTVSQDHAEMLRQAQAFYGEY